MILKSLGHKTRSFGKLVSYVARGAECACPQSFARNLMVDPSDLAAVTAAFEANAEALQPRRGGNWCYHEIIALPKAVKGKTRAEGEAMLFELAGAYVDKRAPRQLVWGRVHWETDHPHLHLVISANEVRSARRKRLPKARFTQLVEALEAWKCDRWPELSHKLWHHRQGYNQQRRSHAETQATRRTGQVSDRNRLAEQLRAQFAAAKGSEDLQAALRQMGLQLYRRGQTWGVRERTGGRRHRLRKLGVLEAFEALRARLQAVDLRLERLAQDRRDACASKGREAGRERVLVQRADPHRGAS
ncbi:MAG: hypothetical protein ACPGFC_00235 [Paracoccaceae bacterium]